MQRPQQTNFSFLESYDVQLVRLGLLAERFFADYPNTCLLKLRQFGELLAQQVAGRLGVLDDPNLSQADLLGRLNASRAVDRQVIDLFHGIRRTGNQAAHELAGDHRAALNHLKYVSELAIWFHRTFGDPQFKPVPFLPPRSPEAASEEIQQQLDELRTRMEQILSEADKAALEAEQERLRRLSAEEEGRILAQLAQEAEMEKARLAEQLEALQREAQAAPAARLANIAANAVQAARAFQLDEAGTRELIDQQLRDQGWEAGAAELSFRKGARPEKGRRLAIAEWPNTVVRQMCAFFPPEFGQRDKGLGSPVAF